MPDLEHLGPPKSASCASCGGAGGVACKDVLAAQNCSLAYATVMTTLDRLYKKGLLTRRRAWHAGLLI